MAIKGVVPYIVGSAGAWAGGGDYPRLGPCNAYFGNDQAVAKTGTCTAAASSTITGTGTAFDTEFEVGKYVSFGANAIAYRITAIASATSMTIDTAITITAQAPKLVSLIYLGQTQDTNLKSGTKKKELTESQSGESAADMAVTGYSCDVELTMTRATAERLQKILQGFFVNLDVNGVIDGGAFTFGVGEMDSDIWNELRLVRIVRGAESTNAKDTIIIPRAAPQVDAAEFKFDAATQLVTKAMFKGYQDETILHNGRPVIWYFGNLTP